MSRQDYRASRRSRIYQNVNKFLIRLIVVIVLLMAGFIAVWVKRKELSETVSQVAERFVADEEQENKEDDERKNTREDTEDENDGAAVKEAEQPQDAGTEDGGADSALPEDEYEEADSAQDPKMQSAAEQTEDAGTQKYQMMRSGAESASQTDDAVIKVKDGKLNNIAAGYTVGEILDLYSETEGQWYTYADAGTSQKFVYYEGWKGGTSFVLEFEVYGSNTFKLTGAMQDNAPIERYSDFFQGILDSLGL